MKIQIIRTTKTMNNTAICLSHIGNRPKQEDNFLIGDKYLSKNLTKKMEDRHLLYLTIESNQDIEVYAISDGMGGHKGGEVASYTCVKELSKLPSLLKEVKNIDDVSNEVQEVINEVNNKIIDLSKGDENLSEMGATLILLVKYYEYYMIFHIGDSRAYYINDNKIIQLTKDHTEGQRILDLGILKIEELKNFHDRFTLNRYLGLNREGLKLEAEENIYNFKEPGFILLVSDGISDAISNANIFKILNSSQDFLENSKNLIREALKSKNADNLTAILIPVG